MLNPYFVFGVTLFLFFLYLLFEIIRKKTSVNYLGFILFFIAAFMIIFDLQLWQVVFSQLDNQTMNELNREVGYSVQWLWFPLILGGILAGINLFRGYRKLEAWQKNRPQIK